MVTTITYDSTYNTIRRRTTVGGSFTTTASYDARSGLETGVTDPMNVTVTNTYDTFYRLTESDKIPVGGTSVWMKKVGYNLGVITNGNAVSYIAETNNDGVGRGGKPDLRGWFWPADPNLHPGRERAITAWFPPPMTNGATPF